MAEELKSYVEKFLLNATPSFIEGNELPDDTAAKVDDHISDKSYLAEVRVGKLRSLNEPSLADKNSKYESQLISRERLGGILSCGIQHSPDDFVSDKSVSEGSDDESMDEEASEESMDDNFRSESEGEEEDLFDDNDHVDSKEEVGSVSDATLEDPTQIQTFSFINESSNEKSKAVKDQIDLYDVLFELRIGLQKGVISSNRLPRRCNFKKFAAIPQHKKDVISAKARTKEFLANLVSFQNLLIASNSETKNILDPNDKSNYRVTDSKKKISEFSNSLIEMHSSLEPFWNMSVNKWSSISRSIGAQKRSSYFAGFEMPGTQKLSQILTNKDALIKRTQLVSLERGNQMKVIGESPSEEKNLSSTYDSEIFDDGDFYSQQLEFILRSKIETNGKGSNMAGALASVAASRRMTKKKVDPKASKGRRIKYKVMSQMQNYLAPCKFSSMSDPTIDKLFVSLFGKDGRPTT